MKNPVISNDILRYKKNKLAANLALLGLAFGCVYFLVMYAQTKNNDYYYKWPIAIDVIYNLFFLLFTFLFSEQVKNYNRSSFVLQIVVGVMQIVRIFWLPLAGVMQTVYPAMAGVEYTGPVVSAGTFAVLLVTLACSGLCIIASAVLGYIRSKQVDEFTRKLENGEVDLDAELKKADLAEGVD